MLWRDPDSTLPNNISAAQRRFDLLMKGLNQNEELAKVYQNTSMDYVTEAFARKLTPEEAELTTWYLLHHGVVNPNKPGKVRVVCDAAAQYCGHSLNSKLMSGPDLLNSLFGVLQRPVLCTIKYKCHLRMLSPYGSCLRRTEQNLVHRTHIRCCHMFLVLQIPMLVLCMHYSVLPETMPVNSVQKQLRSYYVILTWMT